MAAYLLVLIRKQACAVAKYTMSEHVCVHHDTTLCVITITLCRLEYLNTFNNNYNPTSHVSVIHNMTFLFLIS